MRSIFMCDTTHFPTDRSGPAAILCELHDRQPDVLTSQHDRGHERGEHGTHQHSLMTAAAGSTWLVLFSPGKVFSRLSELLSAVWYTGNSELLNTMRILP